MASISDSQFEDRRLIARLEDAVEAAQNGRGSRFIGFLDERQTVLARDWAQKNARQSIWRLFGGYPEAERVFIGVFADYDDPSDWMFPITAVGFYYRKGVGLTHRDILGSLIGCGIVRDKIGDILCTDGLAVAFIHSALGEFVTEQVTKIGREGVRVQCPYDGELPQAHTFRDISGTVASARLDAVLKVLLGVSREHAAELIKMSLVSVNHVICQSPSYNVREGDRLSVKGKGRFAVDDLSGTTSKGRTVIKARKYV